MRISDWSSDVCSSDLPARPSAEPAGGLRQLRSGPGRRSGAADPQYHGSGVVSGGLPDPIVAAQVGRGRDRKSVVEGKRVSVRVDLGGRRIIKKKKDETNRCNTKDRKKDREETE